MRWINMFRHPPDLIDLSVGEVQQATLDGTATLVDVRTAGEFSRGHINGAIWHPMGSGIEWLQRIPQGSTVILICKTGHRSQAVAADVLEQGRGPVAHLKGGMDAWKRARAPIVTG